MNVGMTGRYRMTATKPDGSKRVLADWFPNLITDIGLNRLGTGGVWGYCQVGSGSAAPNVADQALASFVASSAQLQVANAGGLNVSPYYGWATREFRFPNGSAAGNLSEVGIGWAANGSLFSRALILDSEGQPTTITVLSDETLDVGYELRIYPPLNDVTSTVTIGGVEYQVLQRACALGGASYFIPGSGITYGFVNPYANPSASMFAGLIGSITGSPSGATGSGPTATFVAYENNSLKRKFNLNWSLTQGNVAGGGFRSMRVTNADLGSYQFEFDKLVPKDATKIMTMQLEFAWARRVV